jgi:hypothetical protein
VQTNISIKCVESNLGAAISHARPGGAATVKDKLAIAFFGLRGRDGASSYIEVRVDLPVERFEY